ncbi:MULTISPECIES: porin [Pseudoalteromonas]|uniref:Porin n=1 Tax=Pseudoalteromonas fuliginea TaxID=1872678 RepID=A0A063KLQ6_9GAMM|nr:MULTISPECIES: porin [Pseudoalteromonas]ALQ10180.1 porin [Pseudoalteromonas sp. Bsw20308]KAA1156987.1 porin [Pseudoalteromonas fuliginea]KAA1164432.1 porin [Pseudoalteromonas fuliginea]KAA1169191.1 porin [Pseudoalteromonas fuliginea]KDC51013.1 porin [Pseudoalteromonas fuliginea]
MIKTTHLSTLLIPLSSLAILPSITLAADYTVYGKAEVQIANTDTGIMRYAKEGTQIEAPFSRIGIKGQHKLNEYLSAVFKYEVQVKGFEEDDTEEPFTARNTYLGLKGAFGEIVIGRNDTRFKYSEGKLDNFNETQGDMAQVIAGQDRLGDTLTYTSQYWSNAQFSFTYAPKDDNKNNKAGFAATLIYGDRNLNNTPYYVSLSRVDSLNNITASRIVGVYKFEKLQLGALYQHSESVDETKSGNGYVLSASYTIDKWVPKLQFAKDDSAIRQESKAIQWSTGLDYVFDKQTTAYLLYTDLDLQENADNSVALGLKYKF